MEKLRELSSIRKIEQFDNSLEIETFSLQDALSQFMEVIGHFRIKVSSINIFESSLETVFLKLTGKELRDN